MNPAEKRKVSRAVGASFYPGWSPVSVKKSVLFFLFFKKMFSSGCFVFVFLFVFLFVFVFVFVFVFLCFCVFVFLCFCVFAFLCLFLFFVFFVFLFFLGVQPARLKGPIQRPEKARRMGGGHERP